MQSLLNSPILLIFPLFSRPFNLICELKGHWCKVRKHPAHFRLAYGTLLLIWLYRLGCWSSAVLGQAGMKSSSGLLLSFQYALVFWAREQRCVSTNIWSLCWLLVCRCSYILDRKYLTGCRAYFGLTRVVAYCGREGMAAGTWDGSHVVFIVRKE